MAPTRDEGSSASTNRINRRHFLRAAGFSGVGLSLPSVMAACDRYAAPTAPATGPLRAASNAVAAGFRTDAIPHGTSGLWIKYTDFRTSYIADTTEKAAELAFQDAHADSIMSGGEPAGGYQAGLIHQPYTFVGFPESDGSAQGLLANFDADLAAYCSMNGLDVEDAYLHYGAGTTTFADPISSISSASPALVTLKYNAGAAYVDGQSVTISGSSNSAFNGTWEISNVSGGSGPTTFTIPATGTAAAGGTATRTGDGTKSKANRYRFVPPGFPPPRWVVNPASITCRNYQADRMKRIKSNSGAGLSYTPEGIFVDEMAKNNLDIPAGAATVEYDPPDSTRFYSDFAGLFAAIRAALPDGTFMLQINTGNYSDQATIDRQDAAKSTQMEQALDPRTGNWTGYWQSYVAARLAEGVSVELVCPYSPSDAISGGGGVYASDPLPIGLASTANIRMMACCFCLALNIVDPAQAPGMLAFDVWSGDWYTSDFDNKGLNHRWLGLFEVDLGAPTAAETKSSPGTDPLGQEVQIRQRTFQNGLVVVRPTSGYGATVYDDGAAYDYTLPQSSGAGGAWQRVRSDGTMDAPITTIGLRPSEGVVLRPAASSAVVSDTFTRPDDQTSLGTPETSPNGVPWIVAGGATWGIGAGEAYAVQGTRGLASVDSGISDCDVSASITWTELEAPGLIVRGDGTYDNYWRVFIDTSAIRLFLALKINGTEYNIANGAYTFTNGGTYVVRVVAQGRQFTCYVNETQVISFGPDDRLQANTRHGIDAAPGASRFDDFRVETP